MLCTVELMLAGLCINIPTLRPFYLQWRTKYKESSLGSSGRRDSVPHRSKEHKPGLYTQWLELVRRAPFICSTGCTANSEADKQVPITRIEPTSPLPTTTPAPREDLQRHTPRRRKTRFTYRKTGRSPVSRGHRIRCVFVLFFPSVLPSRHTLRKECYHAHHGTDFMYMCARQVSP